MRQKEKALAGVDFSCSFAFFACLFRNGVESYDKEHDNTDWRTTKLNFEEEELYANFIYVCH